MARGRYQPAGPAAVQWNKAVYETSFYSPPLCSKSIPHTTHDCPRRKKIKYIQPCVQVYTFAKNYVTTKIAVKTKEAFSTHITLKTEIN